MKLLFDHNLSPKLVGRLADFFPDSKHLESVGLTTATDLQVWLFAGTHDYLLVSKDADFSELSILHGAPPKVVWLQIGNCKTSDVERILRRHRFDIEELCTNPGLRILILK